MHPRNTFIKLTAIGLALVATPKLLAETLSVRSALAQSPAPTSFPLPASLPSGTTIKVDGSASMSLVSAALKQRFLQQFSGSSVELAANGTDQSLQALLDGEISLAAIGRPLTDAEKAKGLVEVPISREKIAIIVGPENSFSSDVTFEQFAKIFRGEITDWSQLGGSPGPIRFVDRPDFSDTRRSFSNYKVFKSGPFQTGPNTTQVATDETAAVVQELGKDGISYAIADQVLNQSNVKIIPMHQTLPDDPRYPFSQPRGFVYKEGSEPGTQAFLGFATSPAGLAAVLAAKSAETNAVAGVGSATNPSGVTAPSPAASVNATIAPNVATSPNASLNASPNASPNAIVSPGTVTSPEGAIAPNAATTESQVAQAPAAAASTEGRGGLPPWLWWLGLPILGGLLWWFLKGRQPGVTGIPAAGSAAAPAPIAPIVPPVQAIPEGRIVLTPRDCRHAYAYWEVPEARLAEIRDQGGRKKALRLYDVTDIDMDDQVPHSVKQFDCPGNEPDLHVPITMDDRDYIAELGYVTDDGRWLKVARSPHVRVPAGTPGAPLPGVSTVQPQVAKAPTPNFGGAAVAAGAAIAGGAALVGAAAAKRKVTPESRMVLTPRHGRDAYAYWEVPEVEKAALKQQGGQQLAVRLHDVTDVNLDHPLPLGLQQFNCDELEQDKHLTLPETDRDYLAEVGYLTSDQRWLSLARSNMVRVDSSSASTESGGPGMGGLGAIGAGLAGGAALVAGTVGRSVTSDARPPEIERQQPTAHGATVATPSGSDTKLGPALGAVGAVGAVGAAAGTFPSASGRCSIKNLIVHSRRNCFLLDDAKMQLLQQQTAVTKTLLPGTHLIRIKSGAFGYGSGADHSEPIVLLWIHGGTVINQKTNVPVTATWSTLNGYDETLTLKVEATTTLHAFFFDTHLEDNDGEVTLSIISLPS